MILTSSYKSNQFLWLVFKLALAFGCMFFIVERLTQNNVISFSQFLSNLSDFKLYSLKNGSILLIFSFFNWFLEIYKWKLLASKVHKISFKEATKQSLSSLSFSLLTPNRIGEYGAKAYFFAKSDWKKVMIVNGLGNGYQLLTTLLFGIVGFIFFQSELEQFISNINYVFIFLFIIVLGIILFIPWIQKQFKKTKTYISYFSVYFHLKISTLSIIRYFIFSHQFYFILSLLAPETQYIETISAITLVYFISSLIPMLSLFDVAVKGSVAIFVLSWLPIESSIVVTSVLAMWILNFAFPSFLGSMHILRLQTKWN